MSATIRDVASRAGVTATVVSRVLHNKALAIRVSEATAERVRDAAKDLGYKRNVLPLLMRARQTKMIGVLHGVGFAPPRFDDGHRYLASLMDGIIAGAFDHSYTVALRPELMGSSPEGAMADGRFDGLIWYSNYLSEENRRLIETSRVPLALIHSPAAEFGDRFPAVRCDNEHGIELAVGHLVELGHRRIAFAMEGDQPISETAVRLQSFEKSMTARGLGVGSGDRIDVRQDGSGASAYLAADRQHSAIVAAHDGVAAALLDRAPDFGIQVPDDLSIIGFDSTPFCRELRPTLTSIFQPLAEVGHSAVNLLVQTMQGKAPEPHELILPCRLDKRGSTTTLKPDLE